MPSVEAVFCHAWLIRQNGDRFEALVTRPPRLIVTWQEQHRFEATDDIEPQDVETVFLLHDDRSPQGHLIYREFIGGVAA